jgi:hypothetical protein
MTPPQPTEKARCERHAMEEQVSSLEDAPTLILKRSQLIKSTGEWSTIETVSLAVSVATEFQTNVYVERLGDRYRWSVIHRGGPYPLLRITAKYLQVDYTSIIVGCREVGDGWSGLNGNETESSEPDSWVILTFDGSTAVADVRALISRELDLRP